MESKSKLYNRSFAHFQALTVSQLEKSANNQVIGFVKDAKKLTTDGKSEGCDSFIFRATWEMVLHGNLSYILEMIS